MFWPFVIVGILAAAVAFVAFLVRRPSLASAVQPWTGLIGTFFGFLGAAVTLYAGNEYSQSVRESGAKQEAFEIRQAVLAEACFTRDYLSSRARNTISDILIDVASEGFSTTACRRLFPRKIVNDTGPSKFLTETPPEKLFRADGWEVHRVLKFNFYRERYRAALDAVNPDASCYDPSVATDSPCVDSIRRSIAGSRPAERIPSHCTKHLAIVQWAITSCEFHRLLLRESNRLFLPDSLVNCECGKRDSIVGLLPKLHPEGQVVPDWNWPAKLEGRADQEACEGAYCEARCLGDHEDWKSGRTHWKELKKKQADEWREEYPFECDSPGSPSRERKHSGLSNRYSR